MAGVANMKSCLLIRRLSERNAGAKVALVSKVRVYLLASNFCAVLIFSIYVLNFTVLSIATMISSTMRSSESLTHLSYPSYLV